MAQQKSLPDPINDVRIEYAWDLFGAEAHVGIVEQKQARDRAATRILPHRLRITGRSRGRRGIHVYIQGIIVKKDGTQGTQSRGVSYEDDASGFRDYDPARDMREVPAWVQPYVDAVREWEAGK